MNVFVAFLAVTGALAWLTVISGFIFGLFFRSATAEDRATVDLPDVDVTDRLQPFTGLKLHAVPDPDCDACQRLDRGAF